MILHIFVTIMNLVMKFNYKDLLASVKLHVAEPAVAFSRVSYETTLVIGVALLNEISLLIFQNKMMISPPLLLVSLMEHLQI